MLFSKLFRKPADISKVPVAVVEDVSGAASLSTFINLLQHLVNTIDKIQEKQGSNVREWNMEDIQNVMDCFVRMSAQETS